MAGVRDKRWNTNIAQLRNTTVVTMAACADSTSSEEILSDVTSENECNFYNSDVAPHPYRFEPSRVRRNVETESVNDEQTESETNRLGNTDW